MKFGSNSKYLVAKVKFSVYEKYSLPKLELTVQNKRETESEVRFIKPWVYDKYYKGLRDNQNDWFHTKVSITSGDLPTLSIITNSFKLR